MFNRTKAVTPPIMTKTKSATISPRRQNKNKIIVLKTGAPARHAGRDKAPQTHRNNWKHPTWRTKKKKKKKNKMPPPLRQTIKNRLTYVNLTDNLFKQTFVI